MIWMIKGDPHDPNDLKDRISMGVAESLHD